MVKEEKHLTPIRSIKLYCKYGCCAGDMSSWKYCTNVNCVLHCYRMGKRPEKLLVTTNKIQQKTQKKEEEVNVGGIV